MRLRERGQHLRTRIQQMDPEHRRLAKIAGGVALASFVIGFALTALTFFRAGGPIDVVTVPDVREQNVESATRTLSRSELTIEVGDSLPNAAPAGAVLAQSPLPGQEVSPGTQVRVIVSTGQRRPEVPDVSAMPVALATRTLQTAGFQVAVEQAPGEGAVGGVIGTIPAAGTPVALPATVRLRVGAGAAGIPMPSLIGMLEPQARAAAEAAGLQIGGVDYEVSELGEPGGVVGQEPAPGETIGRGGSVRLRVTGNPPATERVGPRNDGFALGRDRNDSSPADGSRQQQGRRRSR